MRIAIHDLGSQTFHLLCARIDESGQLVTETSRKHMVKLGATALADGRISDDSWNRGLEALDDLAAVARSFGGETYAIGTSVLRDTVNGGAFASAAAERLGVPVQILSGDEEAALVFAGALSALGEAASAAGTVVVADLGGGSLELAVGDHRGPRQTHSLPIGTLRMQSLTWSEIGERVDELGHAVWPTIPTDATLVLTGGSARALANVLGRSTVDTASLATTGRFLERLPNAAREALGVPAGRADTVVTAAAILHALLGKLGGAATVSPCGLREGFLVSHPRVAR